MRWLSRIFGVKSREEVDDGLPIDPPDPLLIRALVRDLEGNPRLTDSGMVTIDGLCFYMDGCMDWTGMYVDMAPKGDRDYEQPVYSSYKGVNSQGKWIVKWRTDDRVVQKKVIKALKKYMKE